MRKTALAAIAAISATAVPLASVTAQNTERKQRTEFGLLECNIESGVGFIVGSSKDIRCTFSPSPSDGRPAQQFVGEVKKSGLDVASPARR